jgi:hypothetical protein
MSQGATDLARRLARDAEAVCRHYLSNGRREGGYWRVGDVRNTPGRSLFVRLTGGGERVAGKWTDAATGEHGDLLDLIQAHCGLPTFHDVVEEAQRFLGLPRPDPGAGPELRASPARTGSPAAVRRLWSASRPIGGTLAERYLRSRAISSLAGTGALRFHPRCYYRPDSDSPTETWPAMIAAVTGLDGRITGAHRTWLDPSGRGKAPIAEPRRAMGRLLGHAVRFGVAGEVMAAGEGIETTLSLRCLLPGLPMAAALSAAHLRALGFPDVLRRLYILQDADGAGRAATRALGDRAQAAGVEAIPLRPTLSDFNDDLRELGRAALSATLREQLALSDRARFLEPML